VKLSKMEAAEENLKAASGKMNRGWRPVVAKTYTYEDLKQMTPERRLVLFQNSKKRLAQR